MITVALVGADGAGKTTIAQRLMTSLPVPLKYLYMGTSVESSNVTLPTARLILVLKRRRYCKQMQRTGAPVPAVIATHHLEAHPTQRGPLGATLRLLHRVAEEWYRQFVAWVYQRRGYLVLYDRHFLFEYNPASTETRHLLPRPDRVHLWLLDRFYPRPDLVIFLDAPPDVLLRRKQEWSLDHLRRFRSAVLQQGAATQNFVRIDAGQPLDQVVEAVSQTIMRFYAQRTVRSKNDPTPTLPRVGREQSREG